MDRRHFIKSLSLLGLSGTALLCGCEKPFELSPYQTNYHGETNLNAKNSDRFLSQYQSAKSLRIALVADNHSYYKDFEIGMDQIRKRKDIDLIVHLGDMTDSGLLREFEIFTDIIKQGDKPFLSIIGNHDCLAYGFDIYRKIFGWDDNYVVTTDHYKFIFFNSVVWELNNRRPDFEWLNAALLNNPMPGKTIVFSHIPPYTDQFTPAYQEYYHRLMTQHQVPYSIHGHQHNYEFGKRLGGETTYVVAPWSRNKAYMIMDINESSYAFETVDF